jgi:hypothetical protein
MAEFFFEAKRDGESAAEAAFDADSSPRRMTRSSRRISSRKASRRASTIVSLRPSTFDSGAALDGINIV